MQVTVLQPFHSRMPVAICPSAHPLNTARTQRLRNACVGDKRPGCECETEPSAPPRWLGGGADTTEEDTLASTKEDTLASTKIGHAGINRRGHAGINS